MKPVFSSPAHMCKRKNASDSFDTFLTLMRTLEIVMMNRADFCKRRMEYLEGKLSRYHSEALELRSEWSPILVRMAQKSDLASAEIEQYFSNRDQDLAGEKEELSQQVEFMKMVKEEVGDVINRVYRAPLLASSSNPSPDLCGGFFKTFRLLEGGVDFLDTFEHRMDSWLRSIRADLSELKRLSLIVSSRCNSPSTDHNNHETDGS